MTDEAVVLRGGCQCGAVRYVARVGSTGAYYCHCRMCQRAFGNLFGVFLAVRREDLRWEGGEPAYYRSSEIARRGFCRECGTPLTFEYLDDEKIDVTIGSLDEPDRVRPVGHFGSESIVEGFFTDDGLPRERTDDDAELAARWRTAREGSDAASGSSSSP